MAENRDPGINYWSLIEPVWLKLNESWDDGPEEFVRVFHSVSPEIGYLYAAHWCQSEVCNGGLHQFFSNTTGLLAPEALEGFRAIGATSWAQILAEAMKHFGTPYPRDRDQRGAFLPVPPGRSRKEWDPFYDLDERFHEWTGNWEHAANRYAERNIVKHRS
jgi:hypothetical protein